MIKTPTRNISAPHPSTSVLSSSPDTSYSHSVLDVVITPSRPTLGLYQTVQDDFIPNPRSSALPTVQSVCPHSRSVCASQHTHICLFLPAGTNLVVFHVCQWVPLWLVVSQRRQRGKIHSITRSICLEGGSSPATLHFTNDLTNYT